MARPDTIDDVRAPGNPENHDLAWTSPEGVPAKRSGEIMSEKTDSSQPRAWVVLSFGEVRQYGGNTGYRDDPERVYRYDSFVPNHKRVSPGDLLAIAGREGLLGFARIARIERQRGYKTFFRCPECRTSAIKKRRRAKLLFRCNQGHQFDVPVTDEVECTAYEAHYEGSFTRATSDIPMLELRKACPKYSDQLAIQQLDFGQIQQQAFRSAPELEALLDSPLGVVMGSSVLLKRNRPSREDILAALGKIDESGIPPRYRAKLYEVVHDEKKYPAKYVFSLAIQQASGKGDSLRGSNGGETLAGRVLRRLGFAVQRIGGTAEVIEDLLASKAEEAPGLEFQPADLEDARERIAGEIFKRRGQPGFRRTLLKIYENKCAITGCDAVEVLEACHIVPYLGPKTNHPSNGLILRADLHTLFDLDLITIDPKTMSVAVAPSLRKSEYGSLQGVDLRKPAIPAFAPAAAAFEERRKRASLS